MNPDPSLSPAQPLPDDGVREKVRDTLLDLHCEGQADVRDRIPQAEAVDKALKAILALLPAAQPAPALAEEDRELVEGLRARCDIADEPHEDDEPAPGEIVLRGVPILPVEVPVVRRLLSLATRPGEVPVGWKPVPVEPTEDMHDAACEPFLAELHKQWASSMRDYGKPGYASHPFSRAIWAAMIAAAPAPEGGRGGHGDG